MSSHVVERDLWVREGERVSSFNGANDAIGTLVMRLDSQNKLESIIRAQGEWLKVRID